MNDASNAESNDHENNENDEDNDFNECATSSLNEGSANVDPQTQTIPIIANQSANRNVTKVICGDTKPKCHTPTPCLASPQPQVSYPRAGSPTPSLIHMVELEFVGLLNNPRRIFAQLQKL